jgi:hypothetical protein
MGAADAAVRLVLRPGRVQAQPPVGAAAHHAAVVVVLAVILPAAFVADLVVASRVQGRVAAAGAGVRRGPALGDDTLLRRVRREPGETMCDELLIGQARIVSRSTDHATLILVLLHGPEYCHVCRACVVGVPLP